MLVYSDLKQIFPKITETTIKEEICIEPKLMEGLMDSELQHQLNSTEKSAWNAFKNVVDNFLGNTMTENQRHLVVIQIKSYQKWTAICL